MAGLATLTPDLAPDERHAIEEIALHLVEPGWTRSLLEVVGLPFESLVNRLQSSSNRLMQRVSATVTSSARTGLGAAVRLGGTISRDRTVAAEAARLGQPVERLEELTQRPLAFRDALADRFDRSSTVVLGTEGVVLGAATSLAEAVPFAQLVIPGLIATDVAASTTLLARHVIRVAAAYGFSVATDRANVAHVIAAMAPQQLSHDEGFVPLKLALGRASQEAGLFVGRVGRRATAVGFDRALVELGREAPQLVRLVNLVVERLGVRVSQKAFGMLVPLAGGAVNGSLNVAFQRAGHVTAKDYFRLLVLSQRYGEETVQALVRDEVARLRRQSTPDQVTPLPDGVHKA